MYLVGYLIYSPTEGVHLPTWLTTLVSIFKKKKKLGTLPGVVNALAYDF